MDYLTILSTRSLILFPSHHSLPFNLPTHRPLPTSPLSSPISPTFVLLPPEPIALPISSLSYNETNCRYYLIHHVLTTTQPNPFGHQEDDRRIRNEVEVIVFKELDRVKMFVRELGNWFNKQSVNGMEEDELRDLAGKYGLGLQMDLPEGNGEGNTHGYESKGETMVLV
ncbi:hypothetical protein V866_003125 [Kwoniella sp. B9012]|uniref:Uncharacterized protein n=1 Tax=Kwoniella europaea PYCC6329 TaxID=1423913 RepID=A0AAX4KG60_9TREE